MDTRGPSAMSHQCHITRITAKIGNIFLDPMKSSDLVENPQVGRMSRLPIGVGVQKSCKKVKRGLVSY